jgi:lipid-A-disaccharide synthase
MTYAFARLLVQSKWIGLPNILLQQNAVPEHIQDQCTPEALRRAALALHDGHALASSGAHQLQQFKALEQSLKSKQTASQQVADSILTKA